MKEARIDEVLETIANTSLVYMPTEPTTPAEFLQQNIEYGQYIGTYRFKYCLKFKLKCLVIS